MKDSMKSCQHSLSNDVIYKEVVVIGNGPSGLVTSFMLAGNVPHLKEIPEDLPIDEMLKARLSNLPPGQNLYEVDLLSLAEGLEGRSQNPIPLLMDNLWRPCADMGIQADPLVEWRYDVEKQIEHIVLGRGPPGGAWHTFPPSVRTLSPGAWLALPPRPPAGEGRLNARAVAHYCTRYVHTHRLQRYFRSGVIVTRVSVLPPSGTPCQPNCPLNAAFCVYGYDKSEGRPFRYACRRVVLASGASDRPNTLEPTIAQHSLHSLADIEKPIQMLSNNDTSNPASILVVGSGMSAADAVWLALRAGLHIAHIYRSGAQALARLDPQVYPDYWQVYKMMQDGPNSCHPNYTPHPDHIIVDITPLGDPQHRDPSLRLKRVTLLDLTTNETKIITVSLIAVLIGSKPDLFYLQTNFTLDSIENKCLKCSEETKHAAKRKIEDNERQCFLKNHWYTFKSMLGQSIQLCKSRYLNYTEINGNDTTKCVEPDCIKAENKCKCLKSDENGKNMDETVENGKKLDCKCVTIPYSELESKVKCTCQENPYSGGIGYGIDPTKPVDGKSNPIAIDKSTHELLNGPKGIYALGPLTGDNFVRFIPGGALAIVANIHKEKKLEL